MKYLFEKFLANRDAFAVSMLVCGLPAIYFFRDGLKLAPNSSIFTGVFLAVPFLMSIMFKNLKHYYKPNNVAMFLFLLVFIICILYFLNRPFYFRIAASYEYSMFAYISLFLVGVMLMSKESLNKNFMLITMLVCVFGSLTMLIMLSLNPNYAIGQRASLQIEGADGQDTLLTPHVYSRVAYFGFILSMLLMKYNSRFKVPMIVGLACMLLFLIVLFLTQTLMAIIATFIFLCIFLKLNFNIRRFSLGFKELFFKWYVLIIIGFSIFKVSDFIIKNEDAINMVTWQVSFRINKVINTIKGSDTNNNEKIDESAGVRTKKIGEFLKKIDDNYREGNIFNIFFGNGYKSIYMDNPWLEVFDSFGFFMFIINTYFFYYMAKICYFEARNPTSIATEFIAYGFIYYLIFNLAAGQMMDHIRWGYFALICRFINSNA